MTQGKTLKELDVKPGDVVRWLDEQGSMHTIQSVSILPDSARYSGQVKASLSDYGCGIFGDERFEIVSRATPDAPVMTLPNGDVLRKGDWVRVIGGHVYGHGHVGHVTQIDISDNTCRVSPKSGGNWHGADSVERATPDDPRTSQAEDRPTVNGDGGWSEWTSASEWNVSTHDVQFECIDGIHKVRTRLRKPTRVNVDLFAGTTAETIARIGTIEYQDGKPDAGSIKMEVTE